MVKRIIEFLLVLGSMFGRWTNSPFLNFQFFKPLNPVNVVIHYNNDGRASGEADVDFTTHDEAQSGMTKDRATMSKYDTSINTAI